MKAGVREKPERRERVRVVGLGRGGEGRDGVEGSHQ